jgi:hypothetical protein
MKLVLLCFAAFLACVSCRYDPYADLYTTQKPLSQDIVGRYKLVRQTVTRDGLPALGERRPTVELLADGKFIAINLPPPAAPVRDASFFGRLLSASGNWRIDSVGGVDNGIGRELTHWGVYLEASNADIEPAGLMGANPPYGLIFTVGDPDAGQAMVFERQN